MTIEWVETKYCRLALGDCREVMRTMPADSIDAIVTDPPYSLGFMGKEWDKTGVAFQPETWEEALRIAKPGAHLLAFGGTRTFHRLTCAIEDAGWEIRDCIMWVYGSGFPKSLDVSKAIDKAAAVEREVIGQPAKQRGKARQQYSETRRVSYDYPSHPITAPATDAARQWQGWGTALKPAWEPIIVARKPLSGTVAANVQEYGTGAINIDGCRVGTEERTYGIKGGENLNQLSRNGNDAADAKGCGAYGVGAKQTTIGNATAIGRWPANVIHDGSEEVLAGFPESSVTGDRSERSKSATVNGTNWLSENHKSTEHLDSGSAARFFYTAKASRSDRGEGNNHPTVKPLELMRYLVKLVTPPDGTVLDPFMGSGTTIKAASDYFGIGIELHRPYFEISLKRISEEEAKPDLFAALKEEPKAKAGDLFASLKES